MNQPKKWTLKSIANKLGVSTAAVSYAFSRPNELSRNKREEILAACKELGYYGPNRAAQALRKGKFNIVALVLSDDIEYMVSDPFANDFLKGVAKILEQQETNILLFSGTSKYIKSIEDIVDGFICYGQPRNIGLIEQLTATSKKVVTVDFDIARNASVTINNQQAAYEIAKHALNSSINQVAILGLRLCESKHAVQLDSMPTVNIYPSVAYQRFQGYQRALMANNIKLQPQQVWSIPQSTQESAKPALTKIFNSKNRPELLLCMSDLIAFTAINMANELGLKVGQDIKIVGFDGLAQHNSSFSQLTTVVQDNEEKGRIAAELFINESRTGVELDYRLEFGETV